MSRKLLILLCMTWAAAFITPAAEKSNTVTSADFSGFVLDGTLKPVLTLVRGHTYQINATGNPSLHPFKISTDSSGGPSAPIYTNRITGAQPCCASGCIGTSFTFSPDSSTPDLLYYQCQNHAGLGNQIRIVNPPANRSVTLNTNGLIGITFTNAYSTTVSVQRTTDLFSNNWFTIQTVTAAVGTVSLALTNDLPFQSFRVTTPLP